MFVVPAPPQMSSRLFAFGSLLFRALLSPRLGY